MRTQEIRERLDRVISLYEHGKKEYWNDHKIIFFEESIRCAIKSLQACIEKNNE